MKNLRKVLVTGLSLVLFGTVLAACGGNDKPSSSKPSASLPTPSVSTNSSSSTSSSTPSIHTHEYGDWNITVEPTLENEGEAQKVCIENDDTVTVTLPVLTNTEVWTITDEKGASCTENGYIVYSSIYGDVTVTIEATDHNPGEWEITFTPTLESEGKAERNCSEGDNLEEFVLPVLSNEEFWTVSETVEPSCEEEGYRIYNSTYGEVRLVLAAKGHELSEWEIVENPTLGEESTAKITRECLVDECDYFESKNVNAQKSFSVNITDDFASFASTIEVELGSTYKFIYKENGKWESNNAEQHGTSATMSFRPAVDGVLTFDAVVSSESGWDKFNYDDKSLSGEDSSSISIEMNAGTTYQISYSKDSSGSSGDDNAILSNMKFTPSSNGDAQYYVLSFVSNTETDVEPIVISNVASADCMPENPTKEGYVFIGWFLDETFENQYKGEAINENTTVYAKWTETRDITLVFNNDKENQVLTFTVEEIPEIPSPKSEEFAFGGWYTTETFEDGTQYVPELLTEDITLYAKWNEAPEYAGTYRGWNIYGSSAKGSTATVVIDPDGIISGSKSGFVTSYNPETGIITYKENAESQEYVFVYNDGVIAYTYSTSNTFPHHDIYLLAKGNVTNITHIGLGTDNHDRIIQVSIADGDRVIYLKGNKLYTDITIENLEGTEVIVSDVFSSNAKTIIIKDSEGNKVGEYAHDGSKYLFMDGNQGIYNNGENTLVLNGLDTVTLNGVEGKYEVCEGFIAVYVDNVYYEVNIDKENNSFTMNKPMVDITFDAGEYAIVEAINTNKNIVITLPTPTNETHIFRGWYKDAALTEAVELEYLPTESLTLYAKWDEKINLTIVYGNGLENAVIYYGLGDIPSPVEPEQTNGLVFEGWYEDAEFTTPYIPTEITGSIVIYCNWMEPHDLYGTYMGYEVYSYSSSGVPSIGYSSVTLIVDAYGNVTGTNTGKINDYNPETGEFKLTLSYGYKYGIFDKESGTIAYAYSSDTSELGEDFYLLFKGENVSFKENISFWDNFNALLTTLTIEGEESVNVFIFKGEIYYNVTFTSSTADLTAANAYQASDIKIYDKDGDLIAEFAHDGSSLVYLDGFQGTYTNESNTLVLNGVNEIVYNEVTGTYYVENDVICALINGEYFEINVNKEALTFEIEKPMVEISFDAAGLAVVETITTNKRIDIELPTPTCDSHVFEGWYKDAALTEKIYGDYTPEENTTLYAKWNAKVTLTIVYGNGLDNVELYYAAGDYTSPVVPELTNNLAFEGWYLDAEFNTPYTPGAIQEDLTIYCNWQAPHALYGTYKGYEVWGTGSISIDWSLTTISIDGSGNVTGSKNGKAVDYNSETGVFYIETESYYGSSRYFAKYDAETGVLAFAFASNTETLGNDLFILFKDAENVNLTTDDGCAFLSGNAKLLRFTVDDEVVDVFFYNDTVYLNVTFTSSTADTTVSNAKDADDLTVYDSTGEIIASFVKGENGLELAA